jgi:AcrR family transcriptional regulator
VADAVRQRPGGRSERIRLAVIEATLDALAEDGFAELSVERIAARAGVNKTTLYRRWGSTDDLLVEALMSAPPDRAPPPDTGSLRGDLVAYGLSLLALGADARALAITRAFNAMPPDSKLAGLRTAVFDRRFETLRGIFDRGRARGEVTGAVDVEHVFEVLMGAGPFRLLVWGKPVSKRYINKQVEFVLRAIGAPE